MKDCLGSRSPYQFWIHEVFARFVFTKAEVTRREIPGVICYGKYKAEYDQMIVSNDSIKCW